MRGHFVAPMLVLIVSVTTCATADTPPFKITTKRSNDRVEVKSEKDKVLFDVRSPFGIRSATIERTSEQWPKKVLIQLRLKGLENVKVATDKLKLGYFSRRSLLVLVDKVAQLQKCIPPRLEGTDLAKCI